MRIFQALLIAWLLCVINEPAFSNGVPPMPLNAQLARADLVVVGRLGERAACTVAGRRQFCAEILTEIIVKGAAARLGVRRYLVLSSDIRELSIDGIFIPGDALFFLGRRQGESTDFLIDGSEFYWPIHGGRSVVALNPLNLTEIQRAMCPLRPIVLPLRSPTELSAC